MLSVTWEWLGRDAALDVANTVAVSKGVAHDLLAADGEYERWADAAARSPALGADLGTALVEARPHILELREQIRDVLFATAAGDPLPPAAVTELNQVSGKAPTWLELSGEGDVHERAAGSAVEQRLAVYARSAMEIAARGPAHLRVCGAPSCGMFYRPSRERQRWCSRQCGTRARVARHYRPRRR